MIVDDTTSRSITSDDSIDVIYDRNIFIKQATGQGTIKKPANSI
jgi:hypothetical protein